jgi:hypothetical protein
LEVAELFEAFFESVAFVGELLVFLDDFVGHVGELFDTGDQFVDFLVIDFDLFVLLFEFVGSHDDFVFVVGCFLFVGGQGCGEVFEL